MLSVFSLKSLSDHIFDLDSDNLTKVRAALRMCVCVCVNQ